MGRPGLQPGERTGRRQSHPGRHLQLDADRSPGAGVYTATVQVEDDGEPSLSDSQVFTITVNEVNAAPVVMVGSDTILDEGSILTRGGSFADPDNAQTWSAIVDYGMAPDSRPWPWILVRPSHSTTLTATMGFIPSP